MKVLKVTGLICGGMISLAGSPLLAQQSTSTDPSSPHSSSSSLGQSSSSSTLGSSTTGSHWMHGGNNVRLSHLLNATVQSQDGKTLGTIRDFTVDPQSGHVGFAILSTSPESGVSGSTSTPSSSTSSTSTTSAYSSPTTGKLIPVPWQLFSQSWNNNRMSGSTAGSSGIAGTHTLVLNIDQSKLQSAPSFDASNWNELQQQSFDQQVYSYYGVSRMSGAGTSGSSISGQGTESTTGARGGSTDLQK